MEKQPTGDGPKGWLEKWAGGRRTMTGEDARPTLWRGRPHPRLPLGILDIWKTQMVLRRSKIFIATGIQIAVSSVGAASNRDPQVGKCIFGQHADGDWLLFCSEMILVITFAVQRCAYAESDSVAPEWRKRYES